GRGGGGGRRLRRAPGVRRRSGRDVARAVQPGSNGCQVGVTSPSAPTFVSAFMAAARALAARLRTRRRRPGPPAPASPGADHRAKRARREVLRVALPELRGDRERVAEPTHGQGADHRLLPVLARKPYEKTAFFLVHAFEYGERAAQRKGYIRSG